MESDSELRTWRRELVAMVERLTETGLRNGAFTPGEPGRPTVEANNRLAYWTSLRGTLEELARVDRELAAVEPGHVVEARYLGHDAALAAASWLELSESDAASILDDVDPAVLDRYPGPDLSGQSADGPTPDSLTLEITGLSWQHERDEIATEIADAWEAAVADAWGDALQAHALRTLGRVGEALAVERALEARADALRAAARGADR